MVDAASFTNMFFLWSERGLDIMPGTIVRRLSAGVHVNPSQKSQDTSSTCHVTRNVSIDHSGAHAVNDDLRPIPVSTVTIK